MVAREPRRASPATKSTRAGFTCESSGSFLAMSAAMRLQSSVALGRGALRVRMGANRCEMDAITAMVESAGGEELLGSHGARPRLGTVHDHRPRATQGPADRKVRGVDRREGVAPRPRLPRAAQPARAG